MMPSSPTDAEIVDQVRKGQPQKFNILVDRHLPSLLGFFRYIRVPEEMVDDMIQETFLRAYKYIERYDVTRSFTTWLTVIGRNAFLTEIQKRNNPVPSEPPASLVTHAKDDEVIGAETAREMLNGLDEESKFLIEMRVFRELAFAEIAEITGETVAGLRVRFHRLLKRLRLKAERGNEHEA